MDNRVVIRYREDIAATPFSPGHVAGEVFTVTDAATAKALHPKASIEKYADGRAYVAAHDPSLIAQREAEEAAALKAEEKAKADAEAAKAAKAEKGK